MSLAQRGGRGTDRRFDIGGFVMSFIDFVTYLTLGLLPLFLAVDFFYGARKFDAVRWWRVRAFAVTALIFGLSFLFPVFWSSVLGEWSLLNFSGLGMVGGAVVGVLIYELGHYWYHRAVHRSDFLFRSFHQMHHSSESLDAWSAYYIAPHDAFMFASVATVILGPVLGVSVEAAVLANFFLAFNAIFQHANLKTPRWLGYVIQRPESHGIHHQRGVHAYNYSDLPLWDIVFGTFRNPETFDDEVGYWKGASTRIWDMLLMRDVTSLPTMRELEDTLEVEVELPASAA